MSVGFQELMIGLAILYGLMVFGLALGGWIAFRRGDPERGRLWIAKAVLFAALPLMAFFSLNAMQAAWP
jgi:predicted permease